MAFIDPSSTSYALVKETTPGVTPATPSFLGVDFIPGTMPKLASDVIASATLKANRTKGQSRKANYRVEDGLKVTLKRSPAIDAMWESGLSNSFSSGACKGGKTDTSLTIERKETDGTNTDYTRWVGYYVSKIALACDASTSAEVTFSGVGMDETAGTTAITGATYTPDTTAIDLCGEDVANVSIAGLTAIYRSLNLTITTKRNPRQQFGNQMAAGVATEDREVSLSLTFYKGDLSARTLLAKSDTPVAVSFDVGGVGTGYRVTIPAACYNIPEQQDSNGDALYTVTFMGSLDSVTGTDVIVTKL